MTEAVFTLDLSNLYSQRLVVGLAGDPRDAFVVARLAYVGSCRQRPGACMLRRNASASHSKTGGNDVAQIVSTPPYGSIGIAA